MVDSTLSVTRQQYLQAFRELFPTRLLKRAVGSRRCAVRDRCLPLHLMLGLLITWFFKPDAGLPAFLRWLLPAQQRTPSQPAIYLARGRLGWGPVRWLRRHVLRPLACLKRDPSAFYQGWRLLALDGSTFTMADTPANERCFGRANNQHRAGGYPLARIVALCEVGTHALVDWVVRSYHRSEVDLARRLLRRVWAGCLLLIDRNFHAFALWYEAQRVGFELLIRVQKGPIFPVREVLPDGSYLSVVLPSKGKNRRARGITVRVICYEWTDENGKRQQGRLLTSLLDAQAHPAWQLVDLYHRRWEQETVLREIKSRLACRPMHIRAKDPLRVLQEIDALLLGHFTIRWIMLQAARKAGVPPVSLSFTGAVRVLEVRLARVPRRPKRAKRWWLRWWEELLTELGRQRLRPRSGRRCPRARKVTRSRWPVKNGQKEGKIPKLSIIPTAAGASP